MRATIEDNVVHSPYPSIDIPCCSFYEAAQKALFNDPDKMALADGTVEVTRRELFELMQRYAAGFQMHGLEPGDRVCVHVGTSVHNFAAMIACVFAGASIVLAKTALTERELRYQISDSDCTHVLTEPAFAEKTAKAAASLPIKGFFAMGLVEDFVNAAAFRDLSEAAFREVFIPDPREHVLVMMYTSGTTGLPKGVVGTHYDLVGNMATEKPCFSWDETDTLLVGSPIAHASGFICTAIGVLLGVTVIMTSPGTSLERISELVTKYKVTALSLLQMHLKMLVAEMHKTGNRLDSIRRVGVAGNVFTEAARRTVEAAFNDLECLTNAYAMTESIGIICAPPIHDAPGTDVGFPAPLSQIKVVHAATREKLGPNQTGEICFRTPTMLKRYYKRPKETAELFDEDGWCKSGDAGYYDEDGRLYVVQRLKELIKCMDNQVVPAELENLILEEHSDYISEVVVVGLPHPLYGEVPAAAVVLKDHTANKYDPAHLAKNIKATIADNLAVHKNLYGGVFFFDFLPKTETGKVSRPELAQACAGKNAL